MIITREKELEGEKMLLRSDDETKVIQFNFNQKTIFQLNYLKRHTILKWWSR
jgi:hypothetical protein